MIPPGAVSEVIRVRLEAQRRDITTAEGERKTLPVPLPMSQPTTQKRFRPGPPSHVINTAPVGTRYPASVLSMSPHAPHDDEHFLPSFLHRNCVAGFYPVQGGWGHTQHTTTTTASDSPISAISHRELVVTDAITPPTSDHPLPVLELIVGQS